MPITWMDTVLRQSRRFGTFPYPHQAAFLLDNPIRRLVANPTRLADALELTGSETVLELGPAPDSSASKRPGGCHAAGWSCSTCSPRC